MKKFPIAFFGLLILAVVAAIMAHPQPAQAWIPTRSLVMGNPPTTAPVNGCLNALSTASNGYCSFVNTALAHDDGIYMTLSANIIDTGTTAPNFTGWATQDAIFKHFALYSGNGNGITSISTSAGTATATMPASSPFPTGPASSICITGNTVSAYNACFQLTNVTYSGNFLATMQWAMTGAPGTGTGGNVAFGCGSALYGTPRVCKISYIMRHHQPTASSLQVPAYVYGQTWPNTLSPAWAASTSYMLHVSVKVGSQFFHQLNMDAGLSTANAGRCLSGAVAPSWNTTPGQSTTDGTCSWFNDGANMFPQEAVVGPGYTGTTAGVVNTSGTAVTYVSGSNFVSNGLWSGTAITINGSPFTISTCASGTACTLTTSAGTQSGVSYLQGAAPPAANYVSGGAIYNINSGVGAGSGNCSPVACTANDVEFGFPMVFETPYNTWFADINVNGDGNGNLGVIPHYAQVAWASQITYGRIGQTDLGENTIPLKTVQVASHWFNQTYAQFKGLWVDGYFAQEYQRNWASKVASGATYRLDTGTNAYANANNEGEALDYTTELVNVVKAASPAYGFGSQGLGSADVATVVGHNCANTQTGCVYQLFDYWLPNDELQGSTRHLQLIAPSCPSLGNQAHCAAGNAGSFDQFEQLATVHGFNVFEVFGVEQMCTWDPTFTYANGLSSGVEYADCQANNYQQYMTMISSGAPSATLASQ